MFRRSPKHRLKQAEKKAAKLLVTLQRMQGPHSSDPRRRVAPLGPLVLPVRQMLVMIRRSEASVSKGDRVPPRSCTQLLTLDREIANAFRRLDEEHDPGFILSQSGRRVLQNLCKPMGDLHSALILLREPQTSFQRHLRDMMTRCQISAYALGNMSGVYPSYVTRLLSGERQNRSRGVVIDMAAAMLEYSPVISDEDFDRLIEYSGHVPLRR